MCDVVYVTTVCVSTVCTSATPLHLAVPQNIGPAGMRTTGCGRGVTYRH
jgi:hypothetical protein